MYNALKTASQAANFSVYRRSELPQQWHYGQSPRTPPLLAVANIGYAFHDLIEWNQEWFQQKFNETCKKTHTVPARGKGKWYKLLGPGRQEGAPGPAYVLYVWFFLVISSFVNCTINTFQTQLKSLCNSESVFLFLVYRFLAGLPLLCIRNQNNFPPGSELTLGSPLCKLLTFVAVLG